MDVEYGVELLDYRRSDHEIKDTTQLPETQPTSIRAWGRSKSLGISSVQLPRWQAEAYAYSSLVQLGWYHGSKLMEALRQELNSRTRQLN